MKRIKDSANIGCPICDGHLVVRKGMYGEFVGCSNFPKCKYSASLKDYIDDGEEDYFNDGIY